MHGMFLSSSSPNVLVLTTSNITGAIDLAFIDRADIKQYIGLPSPPAIYRILLSCLQELVKKQVIVPAEQLLDLATLSAMPPGSTAARLSLKLREVALRCQGLSGRTLRKLPFTAHAVFLQVSQPTTPHSLHTAFTHFSLPFTRLALLPWTSFWMRCSKLLIGSSKNEIICQKMRKSAQGENHLWSDCCLTV